jgi:predicted acyl esterase
VHLPDRRHPARPVPQLLEPELLEPERVYEITVDLAVISNVFLPSHRIRPEISSSSFPRYDRNTNTGGAIAEESLDQAVAATNRVLHEDRPTPGGPTCSA